MLLNMYEFRQNQFTECCTFLVGVNAHCVTECTVGNSGMKEGISNYKVPAARMVLYVTEDGS